MCNKTSSLLRSDEFDRYKERYIKARFTDCPRLGQAKSVQITFIWHTALGKKNKQKKRGNEVTRARAIVDQHLP